MTWPSYLRCDGLRPSLSSVILQQREHSIPWSSAGAPVSRGLLRTRRCGESNDGIRVVSTAHGAVASVDARTRGCQQTGGRRTLRPSLDSVSARNSSFLSERAACTTPISTSTQSCVRCWPHTREHGLRGGAFKWGADGAEGDSSEGTRMSCFRRREQPSAYGGHCRSHCSPTSICTMLPLMGEPESAYGGRLFSPTRRSFRTPSGGFLIFAQRGVCAAQGGGSSGEATDLRQASGSLAENQQQGPSEEEAGQPCTRCEAAPTRKYQIFCENCGDVLVPQYGDAGKADFSYFDFLQMAPTFDIDRAALDTKYKQFEKRLHPDKHVLANQECQDRLAKHRMKVVEAVSALKNPAKRALHLLAHHSRHSSTRVDEGLEADRVTDSDLLREVFELNEALEMVTSRAELEEFKRRVDALLDEDERDLSSRFRDKDFDGIRSLIHRYQMHAKLQESIKDWSPPE